MPGGHEAFRQAVTAGMKAALEVYESGDLDRFGAFFTPDVVLHHVPRWPEQGPSVGRDAVVAQLERTREMFGEQVVTFEVVAVRPPWFVTSESWRWAGRASGAITDTQMFSARRAEGDQVAEMHYFEREEEAMKIAGIDRE